MSFSVVADGKPIYKLRESIQFATDDHFDLSTMDSGIEIVGSGDSAYLALTETSPGVFATSGEWISEIIDSGIPYLDWLAAFGVVDYPKATTTLEVFIRVADNTAHFPYIGWGESIYNGDHVLNGGRYLQGKIVMTGDAATTPKVHELHLRYDPNPMKIVEPKVAS